MILIAESGSSKTDWLLLNNNFDIISKHLSIGINPLFISDEELSVIFSHNFFKSNKNTINRIVFYGAGLSIQSSKDKLHQAFVNMFPNAVHIELLRDILSAIRSATFEKQNAVIGIVGTGSNTCVYKDNELIQTTETLGYILGDEGSGNHIGRRLLQLYFYKKMDNSTRRLFEEKFSISKAEVIENVYAKSRPNAYLAGFAKFVIQHKSNTFLKKEVLEYCLQIYVETHLCKAFQLYPNPIFLIGSIAYYNQDILNSFCAQYNLPKPNYIHKPIEHLNEFHKNEAG